MTFVGGVSRNKLERDKCEPAAKTINFTGAVRDQFARRNFSENTELVEKLICSYESALQSAHLQKSVQN